MHAVRKDGKGCGDDHAHIGRRVLEHAGDLGAAEGDRVGIGADAEHAVPVVRDLDLLVAVATRFPQATLLLIGTQAMDLDRVLGASEGVVRLDADELDALLPRRASPPSFELAAFR